MRDDNEAAMDAFYTDYRGVGPPPGRSTMDLDQDLKPTTTPCRICGKPSPRRGRYAGRCADHKTTPLEPADEETPDPDELVAAAQDVAAARRELALARVRTVAAIDRLRTLVESVEP